MLKRFCINIVLIIFFCLLFITLFLPFMAEVESNIGRNLEKRNLWLSSDAKFALISRLMPINAELYSEAGRLYATRSAMLRDRVSTLLKAETYYETSHSLNPYNVRNVMELAALETELFLVDASNFADKLEESIKHFKEAYAKDPNHYIFNYDIGRNLLRLWDYASENDRQFAIQAFRHCLELKPNFYTRIYPLVWKKTENFELLQQITPANLKLHEKLYAFVTGNNIWQHRKEAAELVNKYRTIEQPHQIAGDEEIKRKKVARIKEKYAKMSFIAADRQNELLLLTEWEGVSTTGKNIYKQGNMYWTGTLDRLIYLPADKRLLIIKARGTQANSVHPYMIVELDGEEIGETYVSSSDWMDYSFIIPEDSARESGVRVLSASFVNDGSNKSKNEDRNLFIGEVDIE